MEWNKMKLEPDKISFLYNYDKICQELLQREVVIYRRNMKSLAGDHDDHGFYDHVTFTGSVVSGAYVARLFKTPGIYESEMDIIIILGEIPQNKKHIIEEIDGLPGYFYVHRGEDIWSCVYPCFSTEIARLSDYVYEGIAEFLQGEGYIRDLEEHFQNIYQVPRGFRWLKGLVNSIRLPGFNFTKESHGPAMTCTCKVRSKFISRPLLVNIDRTLCFKLLFWPEIAQNWFKRDRQYGWPSEEVIEEIKEATCYLLPMHDCQESESGTDSSRSRPEDDKSSQACSADSKETEKSRFRLSFSKSEEILFSNLTKEEFICYLIFKSVFYYYLGSITVDEHTMSSYVTKTVMFYKLEQSERSIWIPEKRWDNLGDLFERLFNDLKTGSLPNYFVPEIDVLYSESPNLIAAVTQKLADIKSDPHVWKEAFNDENFDHVSRDFEYLRKILKIFDYVKAQSAKLDRKPKPNSKKAK